MADSQGKVPVRESVGAALRFVRENLQFTLATAAISALVLTVLSFVAVQTATVPLLSLPISLASTFVSAYIFAAFVSAALFGAGSVRQRLAGDGLKLWLAMAVVTFFFIVVFFVLLIPGAIAIGATLGPYLGDLQAAGEDQVAVMQVFTRYMSENPGPVLGLFLVYFLIWLFLSSRLFLAAPASVDSGKVMVFETWKWTKGNMLRIAGARLILLGPAWLFVFAVSVLGGRAFGVNMMDPASTVAFMEANLALYLAFAAFSQFVSVAVFRSLEAALSTYLYRGLKPEVSAAQTFS